MGYKYDFLPRRRQGGRVMRRVGGKEEKRKG